MIAVLRDRGYTDNSEPTAEPAEILSWQPE